MKAIAAEFGIAADELFGKGVSTVRAESSQGG